MPAFNDHGALVPILRPNKKIILVFMPFLQLHEKFKEDLKAFKNK